jgi:hypothetical protein
VSLALGPTGYHFEPLDPGTAWRIFRATPYLLNGSDQRADWIANLLMLIPLGFLATGAFWPHGKRRLRWLATCLALICCLSFVLVVKYFQLFVPPRTVSLNYIEAQGLGSLFGVLLFSASYNFLFSFFRGVFDRGLRPLVTLCAVYTVALLLFLLFPLDFVASADDLHARAAVLPHMLFSVPGAGRSTTITALIVLADTASTVPVGVLLALLGKRRSLLSIVIAGFLMMVTVSLLTMLVLSANPSLLSVVYRTAGITIGAILVIWCEGQDPVCWRNSLSRLVPLMVLPYALAVVFINGLFSTRWRTVHEALTAFQPAGLMPFYYHYLAPKAHAAANVAWQMLSFAPIGLMIGLRRDDEPAKLWIAGILAALFSLAIELGRWFKPGLQPDFSNAIIAAVAAAGAFKLTTYIWHILGGEQEAELAATARGRRDRLHATDRWQLRAELPAHDQVHPAKSLAMFTIAAVCLTLATVIAANYPLGPGILGTALVVYALALWRWPSLWLVIVPAVFPALDLTPWTGWMYVSEPDLFVLTSIAVLVLRVPPRRADFVIQGLPGVVLVLALVSYLLSITMGLALPGPDGGSDNPYLRPDNSLRLAKGFFTALALLPFLRERMRTRSDAVAWLASGMIAGLVLVAFSTLAERALFTGVFDFAGDYRVVGTFSSMHMGGGHIGAYIAMALPFLLVYLIQPSPLALLAMCSTAILGGYALVVTFARAAYCAAFVSILTGCLGWVWASYHRRGGTATSPALAGLPLILVAGVVSAALGTSYMSARFQAVAPDLIVRENNWTGGLALRDDNLPAALFGMGLGTYPRIVLARKPDGHFPSNFAVEQDGAYPFLSLHAGSKVYFEQKAPVQPDQQYRIFFALRSPDGTSELTLFLCEKMLLYSTHCRDKTFRPRIPGIWEDFGTAISTESFSSGWLRPPVTLALLNELPGTTIEVGHIRMLDAQGHDILANGDFARGTARWYFTDDQHLIWRIKDQYLMSFFESGALGLASFALLAGTALVGAMRAIARGDRMAAAVAGSLVSFLCSGVFDYLLEVPRLAALFYIIAFCGLTMMHERLQAPPVAPVTRDRSTPRSNRPARPS